MKKFFQPSAFKLGLILTIFLVFISYQYYNNPNQSEHKNPLLKIIQIAHQKSIDLRMISLGTKKVSNKIAILAIDEESLEEFGRWPWHRDIIAKIIDALKKYQVSVIGFDIIFAEEDPQYDNILAKSIHDFSDHIVLGTYYDPSIEFLAYQEACANQIAQLSPEYPLMDKEETPLILLDDFNSSPPAPIQDFLKAALQKIASDTKNKNPDLSLAKIKKTIYEQQAKFCFDFLDNNVSQNLIEQNWKLFQEKSEDLKNTTAQEWIQKQKNELLKNPIQAAQKFWINVPLLSQGAKHFAFFNAFPDSDGYIRKSRLIARYGELTIPSLAFKSFLISKKLNAKVTLGFDPTNPRYKMINELSLMDSETGEDLEKIPVNTEGFLPINYAGPQKMFPHMSVAQLLSDSETANISQRIHGHIQNLTVNKKDFFKDKIIFVGATAVGIYDMRVTPFEETYPGVETHANITENLLNHQFMKTYYNEPLYMMGLLLGLGIILSFLISHFGAVLGLFTASVSFLFIYFIDRFFLFSKGWVTMIVFPLIEVLIIYMILTFYKYLVEERKKRELKTTFQKYVSPAVVNEILKHPENVNLGGKKEFMTVMFSDLRGFTTLSEKFEPEILSKFLNRYLTPMTRLVFKNNGTLDKYIGDAIMAFYGAPVASKAHAQQACQTALEMLEELKKLNKAFIEEKLPEIDIGIGINTGQMSVGNMGSDIVRSYTVMGDAVNLASRLEGTNKNYGTRIIISETTFNEIKEQFACRKLDLVRVKGKHVPVTIYELVAKKQDSLAPHIQEGLQEFSKGLSLYHEKKFNEALTVFSRALNLVPDDRPTQLYIQRCSDYIQNPPPPEWDGVYEFKTK